MYTQNLGSDRDWAFETVPQAGLKNRKTVQNSGKLLGGSSAINGGFYVAPSRAGSNAWSQLGNKTWNSDVLTKSCRDTIRSHQPDISICQSMGVKTSSDVDTGTCSGPVSVSAKLDPHPVTEAYFRAFKNLGYEPSSALFHNHSSSSLVLHYTEDPHTLKRCGADSAFGIPLAQRPNVTIITNAVVNRVILEGESPNVRAKGVEFTTSGRTKIVLATEEVVLSAGALSSPKILELSGIGGAKVLQRYGIPVVIDNEQVGERLRNHVMAMVHCELSEDVPPAVGMTAMAFMPSQDVPGLVNALSQYNIAEGKEAKYEEIVRNIFMDSKEASACHFMGFVGVPNAVTFGIISTIPFSHGSVHISSQRVDKNPRIDPAFLSHPLDLEILARHIQIAAKFAAQPALKKFFKVDANDTPPASYAVADLERSKEYVKENGLTTYHSCGTAAMLPKEDGGVVDEQLRVHGTENLRVVDASVIPLIPHGNPMATVYGVSNRAADLMLADVSV